MIKFNEDGTTEITLNKEEQEIDQILADNERYIDEYRYVSLCSDLANMIDENPIAEGDEALSKIKQQPNEIIGGIQNTDRFQSYARIHWLNSQRKKPFFGDTCPF